MIEFIKNYKKNSIVSVAILNKEDIPKLIKKIPDNMNIELNISCPNAEKKMITEGIENFLNKKRTWCIIKLSPTTDMKLIEKYDIQTEGKNCLVVGRSNIVGRPMSILMSLRGKYGNATVTLAHSKTKNLTDLTLKADIIIMALGIPEFLKSDMIKKNSTIIDVGITRVEDKFNKKGYTIKGDVDFNSVSKKVKYLTPVPGGVGPMTIAMLLQNTLEARLSNLS